MLVCWSVGGGVGTSVVVGGLAMAVQRSGERVLVVDLCGEQPMLFGAPEPTGPGLAGWLQAGSEVPDGALGRLEVDLAPGVSGLPRGSGLLVAERASALVKALGADERFVVVDAGRLERGSAAEVVAADAERTLLVTRACPLSMRRLASLPVAPAGVVVVRERRRSLTWHEVAAAAGAPVVAELDIDPAVGAAVDAGLAERALPRSFLRVLGGLR